MKIVFLTKRHYMNRDLCADRYGRFYEIPRVLSGRAHDVTVVCHNYRRGPEADIRDGQGLTMISWNLGLAVPYGFWRHYRRLDRLVSAWRPDVLVAASDCYQVIIGAELARRHAIPFIADLYDNFEAYRASHVPGILPWFYRSVARAQAVTVISGSLERLLRSRVRIGAPVHLVENAVAGIFPGRQDRQAARVRFGLAADAVCIGTAGALDGSRGINTLIKAFIGLVDSDPRLHLVLAGSPSRTLSALKHPNIHLTGKLDHADIPSLLSALDVGVISLRDDAFGRYCFPQKFYEMLACGLPLVATRVGEMNRLLADDPGSLYTPDDPVDLQRAIRQQLERRRVQSVPVPTWQAQGELFDRIIRDMPDATD